jgi:hypothetical protein
VYKRQPKRSSGGYSQKADGTRHNVRPTVTPTPQPTPTPKGGGTKVKK